MPPNTVFISYSTLDREHALKIKRALEESHTNVWLDMFSLRKTDELRKQLFDSIKASDLFCVLLSPSAVESEWVLKEIDVAAEEKGLRILPIILRACRIPTKLKNIVAFDATHGVDRESVCRRLVQAACGEENVDGALLLGEAEREYLADKEMRDCLQEKLPAMDKIIVSLTAQPIRKIDLVIHPETLPEDPATILELQLVLDTLFHGTMSFFIAQYREGLTWPSGFDFKEPEYTEFFLKNRPRLDVQFLWFDCVRRLQPVIDGTDLRTLPARFILEFDGSKFNPTGDLNLLQDFEIPCLDTLVQQQSYFKLITHNPSTTRKSEISEYTDVRIHLRAQVEKTQIQLYSSARTREERVILAADYIRAIPSLILREVYFWSLRDKDITHSLGDLRKKVTETLTKRQFNSETERRLAARLQYSQGQLKRFRNLFRDAYEMFSDVVNILEPLFKDQTASRDDAYLIYESCRYLVDTWMRQEKFKEALQVAGILKTVARHIRTLNPLDSDYERIWADCALVSAETYAELGKFDHSMAELVEYVNTLEQVYKRLRSPATLSAWLQALRSSIHLAREWKLRNASQLTTWEASLKAQIGEVATEQLTRPRSGDELPAWLKPLKSDSADWPTKPAKSLTLRYSLRIPKQWSSHPTVRGSSQEVEHIYRHGSGHDADWLSISFMDQADDTKGTNMCQWVDISLALSGFPVAIAMKPSPKLAHWSYLGRVPTLVKKLHADDAHAYAGTANYQAQGICGRIYVFIIRRKTFAWKFVLSLEAFPFKNQALADTSKEEHLHASAILGCLTIDTK